MKLFTRCLPLLLAALLALSACGTRDSAGDANPDVTDNDGGSTTTTTANGGNADPDDDSSLKEIYDEFIDEVDAEFPSLVETPVNKDNFTYYFGVSKTADITETFVSEPMMGAIPFGISMARVKAGADASAIAADMKAKVDPRRWVCVTATYVEVAVRGDVILLVLDNDDARGAAIVEAFKTH